MSQKIKLFRISKDKNLETTTALKLLNTYADSYKVLEKEKNSLEQYIKDLKTNLKISKDIINTFLSSNSDKKLQTLSFSYQKQQKFLSTRIDELTKINIELEKKNFKLTETLNILKEEIEISKSKIFLLEQTIEKKENIIISFKKNLNKNSLVVINPNKAIIKMNDELLTYKKVYEKVSKYLKKSGERLDRYENIIADLQTEKEQLKTQNEIQEYSAIREKENLIYKFKTSMINKINNNNEDKSSRSQNTLKRNINITNNKYLNVIQGINLHNNNIDNELLKNKLKFGDTLKEEKTNKSFDDIEQTETKSINSENEEFCEVLRQAGIPAMTYYMMSTNKGFTKIIDALEFMYKLVCDKKMTIKILECENDDLREKNFQLNKDNIELLSKQKEINGNMINNNQSKITINNVNINTLRNYQKISQNNDFVNEYSESGSVVYNPKKKNTIEKEDEKIKNNDFKTSIINKRKNDEILTLSSVTSSEFGKDCQNLESFVSSIGEHDNNIVNKSETYSETIDIDVDQIKEK